MKLSKADKHDIFYSSIEKLPLFAPSIYRTTDPCKKFLVRPACTTACHEYWKLINFLELKRQLPKRVWSFMVKNPFDHLYNIIGFAFYATGFLLAALLAFIGMIVAGLGVLYFLNSFYHLCARFLS